MSGLFDPSSIVTFFTPAILQMCSPTSLLPVNVIFRTRLSVLIESPISFPLPVTHWIASGGRPASNSTSTSFSAESGVSVAGLISTEFPAASAGPTLCITRFSGKLNGLIAATIPQGTRIVNPNCPDQLGAPSRGTVSPWILFASSAEPVKVCTALSTSTRPSAITLPSSSVIIRACSSRRSSSRSAAFFRIRYRSCAGIFAITLAPRAALVIAASMSDSSDLGIVSISLPSYGLTTEIFLSLSTHSPATNIFMDFFLLIVADELHIQVFHRPRGPKASLLSARLRPLYPMLSSPSAHLRSTVAPRLREEAGARFTM